MLQHSQHFWISVALKQAVGHLQKIFKTNLLVKSNISIADFRLGRAYGDRRDMSPLRERGHLAPVTLGGQINRIQPNSNHSQNRLCPPDKFVPSWFENVPTGQEVFSKLKKIVNEDLFLFRREPNKAQLNCNVIICISIIWQSNNKIQNFASKTTLCHHLSVSYKTSIKK